MERWLEFLKSDQSAEAVFPMPPSVNKYWGHHSGGVYLSADAKRYRTEVQALCLQMRFPKFLGPVAAVLVLHPNGQSCDLDNYEKALWDSLQSAGVLYNDCQVVCVLRFWGERRRKRGITLRLSAVKDQQLVDSLPGWSDQTNNAKDVLQNGKRKPRSQPRGSPKSPAQPKFRRVGIESQ